MPQTKKYDEYISVTFFDQYHRPCPYFERKQIKKMIDSKIEILSLYSEGFVEHFLKERSEFLAANADASFSTFLKEYLEKYYPQQTYAIYQCDIASFLQYITEECPPDDVCEMYKRLFTDFAEALDEKYEVQLSVLHQIRRETYAMFNDNSKFICQDYNQINDFLLKEYDILSLLTQTKQMREYALTHEKGSAETNTIIKEFMRINNAFTQ